MDSRLLKELHKQGVFFKPEEGAGTGTILPVRPRLPGTPPVMSAERKALCEAFTTIHTEAETIRAEYKGKEADMPGDVFERYEKAIGDASLLERKIRTFDAAANMKSVGDFATTPAGELQLSAPNSDAVQKAMTEAFGPNAGFDSPELMGAFRKAIKGDRDGRTWTAEETTAMQTAINKKAQTFGEDTAGGYLVTPVQFVQELITQVKNRCFVRELARNIPVIGAASLGVPTLNTDMSDADWTAELTTVQESTLGFGKRELRPNFLSKLVTISRPLLRMAALDPEAIVSDRASYHFAVTEEKAFLIGNGNKQPLGVMTASSDGIDTDRDKASGTANDFKGDDLIDLYGNLKPAYRPNASWIFHRDGMTKIRKMKDGVGNYIWQPFDFQGRMLTGAYPGLILGRPYYESEYMPSTYTTGNYYAIFGDFSFYWIATNLVMDVQVLLEQYALQNKVGYIFRMEVDAMPILSEAFSRGKVG